MRVVQFVLVVIFVLYNVNNDTIFTKNPNIEIDTNFNRITLSLLLLAFIFEGVNRGKVDLKTYVINKEENKLLFYAVIFIYVVCIVLLLTGKL